MSIFALSASVTECLDALLEAEAQGDTQRAQALVEAIDALHQGIEERAEARWAAMRELAATEQALREEARRLQERAQARARARERIAAGTIYALRQAGIATVKTRFGTLRVTENSAPSIRCDADPAALPPEFRRVKIEANLTALRDAWKRGEQLPEGVTVDKGEHLRCD